MGQGGGSAPATRVMIALEITQWIFDVLRSKPLTKDPFQKQKPERNAEDHEPSKEPYQSGANFGVRSDADFFWKPDHHHWDEIAAVVEPKSQKSSAPNAD
jgi:hypothetical protein